MPTWDDLRRPAAANPQRESEDVRRFAEVCASVFTTTAGKDLMKLMRERYVERRVPPGATEAILREAEAVRGFIFELERARDKGLDASAKGKVSVT